MSVLKFDSKKKPGMTTVLKDDTAIGLIFKVKSKSVKEPLLDTNMKRVVTGSYIYLGITQGKSKDPATLNLATYKEVKAEVIKRYS